MGSSTILEKSNLWASQRDDHRRLKEFLTSSESLGFLSRLLEVVFFFLAILSFLVGVLEEEVNRAKKKNEEISMR